MYKLGYFLIADLIENVDEKLYTIINILTNEKYVITETNKDARAGKWLKRILVENGIKYPSPTYQFIIENHNCELFFHAFIMGNPATIDDFKLVTSDHAKIFLEHEMLNSN